MKPSDAEFLKNYSRDDCHAAYRREKKCRVECTERDYRVNYRQNQRRRERQQRLALYPQYHFKIHNNARFSLSCKYYSRFDVAWGIIIGSLHILDFLSNLN